MRKKYRLGIDAGGTFTDFVFADAAGGFRLFKATSTPEDGTKAIADGLEQIAAAMGRSVPEILGDTDLCINGTTVALNALIQHKGAKVGLLCTSGHEDSIEIRLGHKEEGYRYDAKYPPPIMLVERYLRIPVRERVLRDGSIRTPLDESDVRAACDLFKREGVAAVAVSFVWSVVNPAHERRAADIVRALMPGVSLSIGHEVYPQTREYTRTSTAVLNAYLGPVLQRYTEKIDQFLTERGMRSPVRYYQSNGGMAGAQSISSRSVYAINSGPASAPQAGLYVARPLGHENLITVDMGGTSFDITLTKGGVTNVSKNIDFLRYRIGVPMIQVETLGAGGGSMGWIDAMGLLHVGPQSAGAVPGPACYGRGGTEPTVTDANVVLGYLNPDYLLGGRLKIDAAAARQAIESKLGARLKLTTEKAAYGIFNIVNNNMVNGIRRVSIERGYDPRDFVLIAAGGAAGLHITALAREMGIRAVLVPKLASGLCALGQVLSDVKYNAMAACPMRIDDKSDYARIGQLFAQAEKASIDNLRSEGFTAAEISIERSIDMRYVGQVHECTVEIGHMDVTQATIAEIRAAFDEKHRQLFTYSEPESMVEVVNLETTVRGVIGKPEPPRIAKASGDVAAARTGSRKMFFGVGNAIEPAVAPVYDGAALGHGHVVPGPAVIEEVTTSILIEPGWQAMLSETGTYVLTPA